MNSGSYHIVGQGNSDYAGNFFCVEKSVTGQPLACVDIFAILDANPMRFYTAKNANIIKHFISNVSERVAMVGMVTTEWKGFIVLTQRLRGTPPCMTGPMRLSTQKKEVAGFELLHNNYWEPKQLNWGEATFESAKFYELEQLEDWQKLVFTWNSRQTAAVEKRLLRHPNQLYLWGDSRCGKTYTFNKLCGNSKAIFKPSKNESFPFGDFHLKVHKGILFEDWTVQATKISMRDIHSLLEEQEFPVCKKHQAETTMNTKLLIK